MVLGDFDNLDEELEQLRREQAKMERDREKAWEAMREEVRRRTRDIERELQGVRIPSWDWRWASFLDQGTSVFGSAGFTWPDDPLNAFDFWRKGRCVVDARTSTVINNYYDSHVTNTDSASPTGAGESSTRFEQAQRQREETEDWSQANPPKKSIFSGLRQDGNTDAPESSTDGRVHPEGSKHREPGEISWSDPRAIKSWLDQHVVSQDSAKVALSVAFCDFLANRVVPPTLLLGPSGTGKTLLVRLLCDACGVDCAEVDLPNFGSRSEEGFDLTATIGDPSAARTTPTRRVVLLDHCDRVANCRVQGAESLQDQLADLLDRGSTTESTLFFALGSFAGDSKTESLSEIVRRRLGGKDCSIAWDDLLLHVVEEDLVRYGLKPELVRRLRNRATVQALSTQDLRQILADTQDSPTKRQESYFRSLGIDLRFTDDALHALALLASRGLGAWALEPVVATIVRPFSFDRVELIGEKVVISAHTIQEICEKEVGGGSSTE